MFHVKQGDNMKWVLVQNIPINYALAVMGDEKGKTVVFNSKHEAREFIEKIGEDPEEIMIVPEKEATNADNYSQRRHNDYNNSS